MPVEFVRLKIQGPPGAQLSVVPRDWGDEPPPPVLEAALRQDGTASVLLPRGSYVVLASGATMPADFVHDPAPLSMTITLPK